mgnify:CR=1 FL=1
MALNKKPHFRGNDYNNQELKDAKSLQLNQDAVASDEAVRKSQSEAIADQAAQDILVSLSGNASNATVFTSASMVGFLGNKQDNMEIDSSSTAYLQIVDGYKIKATQLLITDVEVDNIYSSLQAFVDGASPSKQQGDVVILTAASDNQERSWIKTGSASQGVAGYTRLQTDYNVVSIRAMFSAAQFMTYDAASGQFGLDLGNGSGKLGAHTLPIDANEFTSATGSTILAIAKSLESLILNGQTTQATQTQAVDSRISSCTGVSGSDLGSFGGRFSNDATIKQVLQESEQDLTDSESDRAAIRSEFASADASLLSSISTEAFLRQQGDSTEAASRVAGDNAANARIDATNLDLDNEEARATSAEQGLDARLDIVEGGSGVNGSIAKAQADAQAFASNAVSNEAIARQSADAVLQAQIDAIADAFQYKGNVGADGRISHIDSTDANHQKMFENASFEAGDMYKMNVAKTFTFGDASTLEVEIGDSLVALTPCPAGTCGADDFHKWDNTEASDLLREGMLDGATLEKAGGILKVISDSIGRAQLAPDVEADIDSKLEKAGGDMTGALRIDKTVGNGVGYTGGYDFASHIKMKSIDSASLTDTQRALLVENEVYTDGSGNPLDLDYANAATISSHYKGASNDMSVASVGVNGEARVFNNLAAVYATGAYGVAIDEQLGVNAGGTFVAQNGATANLGVFAFSDTAGALNNRGAYFALAPDTVDLDTYRVARVGSPLPVQDAALIVDDYTGSKHAAYFNGKVEINGDVIVPSASADNQAVNLGDVKSKEFYATFTIGADDSEVINHGLGSKRLIIQLWMNDEEVTSSFDLEKSSDNSIIIHNDSAESLSGLEVCIIKLS